MSHDSPVIIRQLGSGDIEVFRRLLDTFGEVFEDVDTYSRAQPREAYLEGLLFSDHFIALAAFQDGAVIGGHAAYELTKFEQERKEMYIYDLAVVAQQRRRGIATGLITQLTTIAKARGAYVIFVQGRSHRPSRDCALHQTGDQGGRFTLRYRGAITHLYAPAAAPRSR